MSTTFMQTSGFQLDKTANALFAPPKTSRRPVPAQRAYLKAMRRAELEAWRSQGGQIEAGAEPFRRVETEIARQRASEGRLFAVVAAIAGAALLVAFREPIKLAENWASFARFVQQLLGI